MSELPVNHPPELDPAASEILLPAHAENDAKMAREEALVTHETTAETQQRLQEAQAAVHETERPQVNPVEQIEAAVEADKHVPSAREISSDMRKIGGRRELKQVQRQLPRRQKALSHVIHQPVIRAISETAGKSISRPSGLLGGGLVAFLGSLSYLYLTKHDGAQYNYFIFLLLFVAGFIVGLVLELIVYLATASARRPHD